MSFGGRLLDILTFGVSKRRSNSNDTTDGAFVDMIKPVSYTHLTLPTKRIV